ncbi:MAG: hypothetical protein KFKLKKLM_01007 [Flavobacteriales bacterium]|nr:hypothetical protein [Flavobacteriales bacterium]
MIFQQLKKQIFPLIFLILGLYVVPLSVFELNFLYIPGDLGDARFNNYILEHGYLYFTGKLDSYWTAPFMFPYQNNIAFSDNLLGSLPLYILSRLVGFDKETAFQVWILLLFVLNFITTYWVLNKWLKNNLLACSGAYIFAFSIMLVGNIYNVQTLPRFILPFLFYWLWMFLNIGKLSYFTGFVFGLVYQFYCGIYLGFLSFYVLLFFFISYLIIKRSNLVFLINRKLFLQLLSVAFIGGIAMLPLMLPYYEHSKVHGLRTFEEVVNTIPKIQSYFFTDSSSVFWSDLSEHGKTMKEWWCHFLYIGIIPWLTLLLAPIILFSSKVAKENKKILGIFLLSLFFSLLFSTNFNGITLYKLIYSLPGFSSMRSVNRIINTELFLFILVTVMVFKELITINKSLKWLVVLLPFMVVADNLIYGNNLMRFNKQEAQQRVKIVEKNIISQIKPKSTTVAYMPFNILDDKLLNINIDAMQASQNLGLNCVNAYTGSYPEHYWPFFANLDQNNLTNWLNHHNQSLDNVSIINEISKNELFRKDVFIKFKDAYLSRNWDLTILADKREPSLWETFTLVSFEDGDVALRTFEKLFVTTELNDKQQLFANRKHFGNWETINTIKLDDDFVAFKAVNGKYWSVNPKTLQVFATADEIGENERFKIQEIN